MKFVLFFVSAVLVADGAYEGENCDSNGSGGVCMKLSDCASAREDLKHGKSPPSSTCISKTNVDVVCCEAVAAGVLTTTTRSNAPTTAKYVPKEYEYENLESRAGDVGCEPIPMNTTAAPTGQKAWDKCIDYQEKYVFPCEKSAALSKDLVRVNRCHHNADELILGGTAAASLEFPHMVLLGYQYAPDNIEWKCGGALISEKFVLTAAHCISDDRENNVSHALIGILRRSEEADSSKRYGIKRIVKHDQYHSPGKYNDIALLELDRGVKLDHTLVPACLHTGEPVDESRASATGWGTTQATRITNSDILQKVILTKFSASECTKEYEGIRNFDDGYQEDSQICYGERTKSQDTCRGDSGGPLQVKSKRIVCMYTVVGVTSFGQECGLVGVPGIYTRVAHYLPWIESVVWPN